MQTAISLRGISKRFRDAQAPEESCLTVDGVNLDVSDGEFFVIVWPRGCGKSTILRLIAGLEDPTEGELNVARRRIDGVPTRNRRVGLVPEGYALFQHMTVAQNVGFGLKTKNTPRRERRRRMEELADVMGLEGLEDRKPHQLSGAQRLRVALARALAPGPKVLLLDQPFGLVEANVRRQIRAATKKWQRDLGIPTILVTHDQREALEMVDRVAVMNEGRFEQTDTPQNLYEHPATEFVGRFMGSANGFAQSLGETWGQPMGTPPATMAGLEDISALPWERDQPLGSARILGAITSYAFLGRTVRLEARPGSVARPALAIPHQTAVSHPSRNGSRDAGLGPGSVSSHAGDS